MAVYYNEGELKTRPSVYQRTTNAGFDNLVYAHDGICAIPIKASWGPLGKVVKHTKESSLVETYGDGEYSTKHTVPAAAELFKSGAATVYTYRMGTGGKNASVGLSSELKIYAKYPGDVDIHLHFDRKIDSENEVRLNVFFGDKLVENFEMLNGQIHLWRVCRDSRYIEVYEADLGADTDPIINGESEHCSLEGGVDPTITNEDYSKAFAALEPYYYNTITLDVDDDTSMTLSNLLHSYMANASKLGKTGIAVVGQKSTVAFDTRRTNAASFNDANVVFLGGGYMAGTEDKDGLMAICHTAGVIASTPSNQGITHLVIGEATALCESLTYSQYVEAIAAGMLMLSVAPDGSIWYDSGINTLTSAEDGNMDEGWKKIRRAKVRYEMYNRLDRVLAPKVGRVSADTDGVSDIIQSGQRVLDAMVAEGKLRAGALFTADPAKVLTNDSAWFIVQADDIDSLEKIYLHYQFRYSQNS